MAQDVAAITQHVTCPTGTRISSQCQTGTITLDSSTEDFGVKAGLACAFPFTYKGVTYDACTEAESAGKPWCATVGWANHPTSKRGYCDMETCTTIVGAGTTQVRAANSRAEFHTDGGQADFVWLTARTPHGGCVRIEPHAITKHTPPEQCYRSFPCNFTAFFRAGGRERVRQAGGRGRLGRQVRCPEPFNSTPIGVNPISPGSPRARPMGVHRTRGA